MRTPRSESTWRVADLRNICFEVHKPGLVQRDLVFGGRLGVGVGRGVESWAGGRGGGGSGTMVVQLISVKIRLEYGCRVGTEPKGQSTRESCPLA